MSDNVCTKMVLERLTLEEVDSYCKAIGMAGTHHRFLIPPLGLKPDHSLGDGDDDDGCVTRYCCSN